MPTRPDCPPAAQRRLSVHETEESAVTPGGRVGTVQVRAPSAVVATTAPPDVADPTATHLVAVEHDTAVSVLTVGGTKLAVSTPVNAEGGWVEVVDAGVVGVAGPVLEVDDVELLEPHPARPVALTRRAMTDAAIADRAPHTTNILHHSLSSPMSESVIGECGKENPCLILGKLFVILLSRNICFD